MVLASHTSRRPWRFETGFQKRRGAQPRMAVWREVR